MPRDRLFLAHQDLVKELELCAKLPARFFLQQSDHLPLLTAARDAYRGRVLGGMLRSSLGSEVVDAPTVQQPFLKRSGFFTDKRA